MPSLIPAEVFQPRAYLARAMPGMLAPPQASMQNQGGGDLVKAFQMMQNKGQGQTNRPGGTGVPGPMGDSVMTAAMMSAAGLTDDEKDKYKSLPAAQLREVLALRHQAGAAKQPQQPLMNPGAAAVENPQAGTMSVKAGSGANGPKMSEEGLHQWSMAAKTGQGKAPVTNAADLTAGGQGFTAKGLGGQAQPQQTPLQQAVAKHMKDHPDSLVGLATTPEQAMQQMNHERTAAGAGAKEKAQGLHTQFSENKTMLDELQKQEKGFTEEHADLDPSSGKSADPNVTKDWRALQGQIQAVRSRMSGMNDQMSAGGGGQAPEQPHVPHAQFGPDGKVVPGSRGPIAPDIAAHYIRRAGSVEAGKAAAAAEGWQF